MGMDLRYRLKKLNLGVISIDVEAEAVDRQQVDCADRAESDMRTQICVGSNHNPPTSYHPGSSREHRTTLGLPD